MEPKSDITAPVPPIVHPPEPPILSYQRGPLPKYPPHWTNIRIYGYLPEALPAQVRKLIIRRIILSLVIDAIVITIVAFINRAEIVAAILACGAVLIVFSGLLALRLWREIYQLRSQWPTVRFITADQGLFRCCSGYPDLTIPREKIRELKEIPRGIYIRGTPNLYSMLIPPYVEHFSEVRDYLATLQPIKAFRHYRLLIFRTYFLAYAIILLYFGCWILGLYTAHLWLELLCLAAVFAVTAWLQYVTWRNPNATWIHKFTSLWMLLIPAILLLKIPLWHYFR